MTVGRKFAQEPGLFTTLTEPHALKPVRISKTEGSSELWRWQKWDISWTEFNVLPRNRAWYRHNQDAVQVWEHGISSQMPHRSDMLSCIESVVRYQRTQI